MTFGNHTAVSVRDRGIPGTVIGGKQWKFRFDNGFGASVINDGYGSESGLFELAVLGPDDHLTYDTPVTDDVLGFLTEAEVAAALDRIAALSPDDVTAEIARRADGDRDRRIAELRAELAEPESEAGA